MSTPQRNTRRIWTALVGAAAVLAVTACGGGGSSEEEAERTVDSILEEVAGMDSSVPDPWGSPGLPTGASGAAFEVEFEEVPGTTIRFVNTYSVDGVGAAVDVYWGRGITTGQQATTVPYGTISDPIPVEVEADSMFDSADGEQALVVSFYPEGATEGSPIGSSEQVLDGEATRFVAAIAADDYSSSIGEAGATTMLGTLDGTTPPPAGQAVVVLNDLGVQAIDDGDFLTLSPQGQCGAWELFSDLDQVDADTGNLGTAYVAPAGSTTVVASDANTDCATGLPPVDLDVAAGGVYVLYAYGTSIADRQLLVLDASE